MNTLYYGDNLQILRDEHRIPAESVDLCYIDPPFNSKQLYNVIYSTSHQLDRAQTEAFTDMWTFDTIADADYGSILSNEQQRYRTQTIELVRGLYGVLNRSGLMAYIVSMTQRFVEIHRVLKSTGSFYLHCDSTASHYLKLILDSVFGPAQFRNEIIWRRTGSHNSGKRFGPIHDTILFYTKGKRYTFNKVFRPYLKGHTTEYFKSQDERGRYWTNALTGAGIRTGASGKPWRGYDPTSSNRHWAIPRELLEELDVDDSASSQEKLDALEAAGYIDFPEKQDSKALPTYRQYLEGSKGVRLQDIWAYQPHTRGVLYRSEEAIDEDVRWLVAQGDSERIGWQTQKPEGLLDRIIKTSTNKDDMVLDAYCGCGTTLRSAERLKRKWKGIDITYTAIAEVLKHFEHTDNIDIDGIPKDYEGAVALANRKQDRTRKEFEKWAVLTYTNNRASINPKKGADAGIDGVAWFAAEPGRTEKAILQVKSGHVERSHIATLVGDMKRSSATIGVFITLNSATRQMKDEAKAAGVYIHPLSGTRYDRVMIVEVRQIIELKASFPLPARLDVLTKSRRASTKEQRQQGTLDLESEPS